MSLRRIIFWAHLITGCVVGIFIFLMATTGLIMTYERQIVSNFELQTVEVPQEAAARLTADELSVPAFRLTEQNEDTQLIFHKQGTAPISVLSGRSIAGLLNPYTGKVVPNHGTRPRAFFSWVRSLHRWLALEGAGKDVGKTITGAVNIGFAIIILSGLYLWLPKVWRWQVVRAKAFFRSSHLNTKARDYNWHHVFGIWALLPLLVISLSGMVFSYDWASDLVYRVMGDEPPAPRSRSAPEARSTVLTDSVPLQMILEHAEAYNSNWRHIQLELPNDSATMDATVYLGTGGQPTKRSTLTYDLTTGGLTKTETFGDIAPGRRARIFIRYLHTGEVFGIIGQTIAGLSALAACFLVYTGLALAFRRLALPHLHRRKNARKRHGRAA